MRRIATLLVVPAVLAGLAALLLAAGLADFSASAPPSKLEERVAQFALNRSIAVHAPKIRNPLAGSPSNTRAGLLLFRAHCVACHGAPGIDPTEEGASLNPPAPGLTLPRVQSRPDGELFWIVSRGIRMTGMPAFGASRTESELWQLVAAIRRLQRLSADERALVAAR